MGKSKEETEMTSSPRTNTAATLQPTLTGQHYPTVLTACKPRFYSYVKQPENGAKPPNNYEITKDTFVFIYVTQVI